MQSTLEKDDKQAGLSDLVAILDPDPARVMLEPPDLHADPVNRAMSLAAQLPAPDPTLRAAPPVKDTVAPAAQPKQPPQPKKPSAAGRATRALLAIAVGAVITVGCLSYGEAARQMLAAWAPQLVAAAPAPTQDAKVAEQVATAAEPVAQQPPAPPTAVAAATAPPPPALETPAAPAQAVPVQAAATSDLTPKLEEMAREIASLRETIEQLKSGQQQISRDLAKAIDQEPRRKTATSTPSSAPKPTTTAVRNPPPPPPQPAYTPPPQQRQVYTPPRDPVYAPRDPVYAEPPRVYTPPPPQVYSPPPSSYEPGAPRPPRALP